MSKTITFCALAVALILPATTTGQDAQPTRQARPIETIYFPQSSALDVKTRRGYTTVTVSEVCLSGFTYYVTSSGGIAPKTVSHAVKSFGHLYSTSVEPC